MPEVFAGSASYPPQPSRPVLTIGNFDGVHRGHRHLIDQLVHQAHACGSPACVYTFEPPPRVILAPRQHRPRIMAWPDKVRLLGQAGVDQVIVERFTRAFAQHPSEWFTDVVLGQRINPCAIVVGYDFRFGRARAGNLELIRNRLPDVILQQVSAFDFQGGVVSSSRVRELVLAGEVEQAAHLLGRPHFLRGTVVAGDRRGRQIGFPTANIDTDGDLIPAMGVYAVIVRLADGQRREGVANLGMRPTFQGRIFQAEVHILDFRADLYGKEMEVGFVARLRGEQRFPTPDALIEQIHLDMSAARAALSAHAHRQGQAAP